MTVPRAATPPAAKTAAISSAGVLVAFGGRFGFGRLLRPRWRPRTAAGMFTTDEELARSNDVGRLIHQAIAELATETSYDGFGPATFTAAASRQLGGFRPIEARAHRQNVAAGIAVYFGWLRLPSPWAFVGAELQLGGGRTDLLWRHDDGRLLVDEIKTGNPRRLLLRATREQVERYLALGRQQWGPRFVGVRLLSTADPVTSLFVDADGATSPLHVSEYVATARAQRRRGSAPGSAPPPANRRKPGQLRVARSGRRLPSAPLPRTF
jgi:hypothetical protein